MKNSRFIFDEMWMANLDEKFEFIFNEMGMANLDEKVQNSFSMHCG
jgi:hypothetical protein